MDKLNIFKRNNQDFTVIYGAINYKNQVPGKDQMKDNIRIMYGDVFLNYIFEARKDYIINSLRTAFSNV